MKENDTEELSNSMFINVITSSFLVIFPKLFREELLGFQFRVELHRHKLKMCVFFSSVFLPSGE